MWKSLTKVVPSIISNEAPMLIAQNVLNQQLRTTYILKRRFPPRLHKKGMEPKKMRSKNYIYDLVKDTTRDKQPLIDIILTSYVEGLGNIGDRVSLKRNAAYTKYILPGLATYATPENIEKYGSSTESTQEEKHSSPIASLTLSSLSRLQLAVVMNKDVPWTLKPWHIRVAFRKSGYVVPESAITMPEKSISGPDMNLEGKQFLIKVTINNKETANVRCRIHHWSTDPTERLPYTPEFYKQPPEALFPEESPILKELYDIKMKGIIWREKRAAAM